MGKYINILIMEERERDVSRELDKTRPFIYFSSLSSPSFLLPFVSTSYRIRNRMADVRRKRNVRGQERHNEEVCGEDVGCLVSFLRPSTPILSTMWPILLMAGASSKQLSTPENPKQQLYK